MPEPLVGTYPNGFVTKGPMGIRKQNWLKVLRAGKSSGETAPLCDRNLHKHKAQAGIPMTWDSLEALPRFVCFMHPLCGQLLLN